MVGYQYEHVITLDSASEYEMLCAVEEWFEESCSLRFVQSVRSALEGEDPNKGFTVLIEQGFGED